MSVETNVLRRSVNSLRTFGVRHTLENAVCLVEEYWFEYRFRLQSLGWQETDTLDLSASDKEHAHGYKPARLTHFRHIINRINLPGECVFVDFGSGKGRLLIAAIRLGFTKVVGVELSHALCTIAHENIRRALPASTQQQAIRVVQCNAVDYVIQPNEDVFYFYNPFDGVVLRQVLANIAQSLQSHPRPAWLIYNNPRYAAVIEQHGLFTEQFRYRYGGSEAVVYACLVD